MTSYDLTPFVYEDYYHQLLEQERSYFAREYETLPVTSGRVKNKVMNKKLGKRLKTIKIKTSKLTSRNKKRYKVKARLLKSDILQKEIENIDARLNELKNIKK